MNRYSEERKKAILRRMRAPENKLVSELARENGISKQTLYHWQKKLHAKGMPVPGNGKNAEDWSSKDKFSVVLDTASLNQAQLAEYCRSKGLFIEQIAAWSEACQQANAHTVERTREQREQSKNDRKRQDHRAVKRVTKPMLNFKSFRSAKNVLAGIERMHMIRKGQLMMEGAEKRSFADQFYALVGQISPV
jgi:transposase-like protein